MKIMVILIMLVMVNVAIDDADADFDNGSNYKFAIMRNNNRCFQGFFLQTEHFQMKFVAILLLRHGIFRC